MDWKKELAQELMHQGGKLARRAKDSHRVRQGLQVARTTAMSMPVKELAVMCGRTGMAGAIVDGALGGVQALKAMKDGKIDAGQAIVHTGAEAGCGFVTSASGTAGTLAVYMITGSLGPVAIAAGMGASMGSRYLYRQAVGETMPEQGAESFTTQTEDDGDVMEHIGPSDD